MGIHGGMKNTPHPIEWNAFNFCSQSTHAEMNAIVSHLHQKKKDGGRRKSHCSKHNYCKFPKTIVVISLYKGRLRQSRPCDDCINVMRLYKIKNVIYSTGDLETPFLMEKIETMPFLGHSRGNR